MTGTEIATRTAKPPLRAGGGLSAIVPQDAEQAWRMAEMIARSGLAPRDMKGPEQIVTAIFHGLEIGLKPMQAVQSIAVVNGRPTVWGDAALGLVESSGLLEDFAETVEGIGDAMVARCRAKRVGRATPIERTFSVADAKAAGLWGKQGPWQQYKQRMLQLRARAFTLRDGFADVLRGMQITEEARDYNMADRPLPAPSRVTSADLLAQGAPEAGSAAIAPPPAPVVADPPPAATAYAIAVNKGRDGKPNYLEWTNTALSLLNGARTEAEVDETIAANLDVLDAIEDSDPPRRRLFGEKVADIRKRIAAEAGAK